MKDVLRPDEAADILKTSKRTIYRLINEGELEAFHVRGVLRITAQSVTVYIRRQIRKFQEENGILNETVT